jgi:hypothetical protein
LAAADFGGVAGASLWALAGRRGAAADFFDGDGFFGFIYENQTTILLKTGVASVRRRLRRDIDPRNGKFRRFRTNLCRCGTTTTWRK